MGKRRIRCLKALGNYEIFVYDKNLERADEVVSKYKVKKIDNPYDFISSQPINAIIVSTSPESHLKYIKLGLTYKLPTFVEASVCDTDELEKLLFNNNYKNHLIAPSCTMKYFEFSKIIRELILEEVIGKILYFEYRVGQYLPNWHPWENVNDYYVSNRKTGGCREIVPFELTWINEIFGEPDIISSAKGCIGLKNLDIDDFYHFFLKYKSNTLANITVEVLSKPNAVRELRIAGDKGQIVYNQDENFVKYATKEKGWKIIKINDQRKETGYIYPEKPYIDELSDFIKAFKSKNFSLFPNNLKKDISILRLLEKIDNSSSII